MDEETRSHVHEAPAVVTVPLILLAIPSILIGYFTVGPVLFGGWLSDSITVKPVNDVLAELGSHFHGPLAMAVHAVQTVPFWLMIAGFAVATFVYRLRPASAAEVRGKLPWLYRLLDNKYYFDELYRKVFAEGGVRFGTALWRRADAGLIDGIMVNGSAHVVNRVAGLVRRIQTGYLYHYAFAMIIGLIGIIAYWAIFRQG
jgi:NADH-quinone oxidoreductase subunit L